MSNSPKSKFNNSKIEKTVNFESDANLEENPKTSVKKSPKTKSYRKSREDCDTNENDTKIFEKCNEEENN